jgi:hypothetical protein
MRGTVTIAALFMLICQARGQDEPLKPQLRQEMWISAGVKGRAPVFLQELLGDQYGRILLTGELGYRSADNFFAGRQIYTDLGARYKVTKWLSMGAEYRYAARYNAADRQRLGLRAWAGHSLGRLDLGYRFTFQRNYLERDRQRTILRNRISALYNIRKWKLDPELSVEFFTRTDRPDGWYPLGTRYKLATSWSPWKGHSLEPALIYDSDGRVNAPVNRIIWSLDYRIDLRKA